MMPGEVTGLERVRPYARSRALGGSAEVQMIPHPRPKNSSIFPFAEEPYLSSPFRNSERLV